MHFQRLPVFSTPGERPSSVERILSASSMRKGEAFDLADALGQYVTSARFVTPREVTDWLAGILSWIPGMSRRAEALAGIVVDSLIAAGGFGIADSFGQKVLLQLPGRSVLVPGIGRVRLGGLWMPESAPAFPGSLLPAAGDGHDAISLLDAIGLAALTPEIVVELRELIGRARQGIAIEGCTESWQKRLIVLTCSIDTSDLKWKMAAAHASAVLEWAGIMPVGTAEEISDPDQALVVSRSADARTIISAGPGTGKTQVVCRRIVHLVEEGTSMSRIWLLSFTRVAVEEMRQRIARALSSSDAVGSLHVATFDSFASRILSAGLPEGAARPKGYDAAVGAASAMLLAPSQMLRDFFAGLGHVVIDEAQDLLGSRLTMMRRFIELLPVGCGVTILGDKAQSIYGWSASAGEHPSLLDPVPGFQCLTLRTDHRTQDTGLSEFFGEARDLLLNGDVSGRDLYIGIRERIEQVAFAGVTSLSDPVIPAGGRTMVLFRDRRALLSESHRLMTQGRFFRLRPSSQGQLVRPWIGALLAGLPVDSPIARDGLAERFAGAVPVLPFGGSGEESFRSDRTLTPGVMDEAWEALLDLADSPGRRLDLRLLHRRLAGGSLRPDLLRQFLGNSGPLLGTIHGAKGLEADHVGLMLPRMPEATSNEDLLAVERPFDFDEEARVLYVGATRAKRRLYVGSQRSGKLRRLDGSRSWRGYPGDFSMEIGIEGDVVPVAPGGRADPAELLDAARALAAPGEAPKARGGVAVRDARSDAYGIFRTDRTGAPSGSRLGFLSASVLSAFAGVAQVPIAALPARIGGFFLSGAATVAWGGEDEEDRGIALIPVLCGLATISMETSR